MSSYLEQLSGKPGRGPAVRPGDLPLEVRLHRIHCSTVEFLSIYAFGFLSIYAFAGFGVRPLRFERSATELESDCSP